MIRIHVQFRVRADQEINARSVIGDFLIAIREEESETRLYESFVAQDGRSFVHVIEFQNPAAQEAHRNAAHTKRFVEALYPLCESEPVFTQLYLFDSNRR